MTAASLEAPYGEQAAARSDRWAFALGVLMVLIYSQAAVAPLSGETGDPEASGLLRALYYPAYAAAIVLIASAWRRSLLALLRAPLLIALVGLAATSVLWSAAPDITARRSVALAFTCLSGVALAARFSWARLTEVLATGFAILAGASVVTGLFVPGIGRMSDLFPGAWRGLWFEKNALGQYMTIGFCVCAAAAALNPDRRRRWGAAAVLTLLLVLLSTSKTSLASLVLAAGMFGFVWLVRRGPAAGIAAVWLGVVVAIGVAGFLVLEPDRAFALFGKDATLTGRTKIWAAVVRRIHERPAFGWGYGAVWDDKDLWAPLAKISREAGFVARHAHSSWMEQALGLGVAGLALWSLWFAETVLRALFALFTRRSAYLAAPYLAAYALTSLTESVTLIWNELTWVMFVIVAVKLALGERPPQFALTGAMRASPAAP
jgi:exopolysaccharide production protein ExoQ